MRRLTTDRVFGHISVLLLLVNCSSAPSPASDDGEKLNTTRPKTVATHSAGRTEEESPPETQNENRGVVTTPEWTCPEDMVLIPGGSFAYGPGNRRIEIKVFCLDRTEVSAADYNVCVQAGHCTGFDTWTLCDSIEAITPNACNPDRQNYPANWMSFFDARTYCSWLNRRLPTDHEWERSVRGDDGRPYPWGNEIDCSQAHYSRGPAYDECKSAFDLEDNMVPVNSYLEVQSPYGTINQAGNAKEWVDVWYGKEPDGGPGRARGGSWRDGSDSLIGIFGDSTLGPDVATDLHGFRCAAAPLAL